MDNTTILYNSIQRIYRSAIINLIRHTFEGADLGGVAAIKTLFSKRSGDSGETQWDLVKSAAEERRSGGTGELSTPIKDEYEIIGVEHFYNIFEKYFDSLCPVQAARSKKEKSQARQVLLTWIKQIKNVRDPVSHPTTEDISYEDSVNTLHCARRILDFCQLPDASSKILRIQKKLLGGFSNEQEKTLSELPPSDEVVMDFVGRHHELGILTEWVDNRSSRRWALSGEGGKGKSAIAYIFGKNISSRDDHGLDGVFWVSAKRRRFVEGTTILVDRPDFYNKETAISAILSFFGASRKDTVEENEEQVFALLTDFPSLLIIDDIDTVEADGEDAIQFLVMTVPERTKSLVLVTSRRAIFGMANVTTQVAGLSSEDAEKFIKSRCELMGISAIPILNLKDKILEITDASPLFLEDLLRLTQTGFEIEKAMGLWAARRGNEARRYAIQREYDQLENDAKQVLLALSFYGSCKSSVLCQGLDWDEGRLLDALQQLRKMFLMSRRQKNSGKEELALGQNTQLLVRDVFSGTEAYRRTERLMKAIAGRLQTSNSEDQQVNALLKRSRYLTFQHQAEEAEKIVEAAINQYPARSDLYANIAWIQLKSENFASARMNFKRAHDLGACNADAYWHWSSMEARNQEWNASAQAAELGTEKFPDDAGLLFRLGYALHRAGRELNNENNPDAIKYLKSAQDKLERALEYKSSDEKNYTLRYQIFRSMALNFEAMDDLSALPNLFERWESECPEDYTRETERQRLGSKLPELLRRI